MTDFIITACYEPKMDKRREQRIRDALERCDVKMGVLLPLTIEGIEDAQVTWSDVNWNGNRDGTGTELEIYVDNPLRATRLASELWACGMVVHVDARNEEEVKA
jgi:hypothetical protein